MRSSRLASLLPAVVIVLGLAVVASGANLIRAEWVADHAIDEVRTPAPPATPPDLSGLAPAEKLAALNRRIEALQRDLDVARRRQSDEAAARTARTQAQVFLQISVTLMVIAVAALLFQRRRGNAAAAGGAGAAALPKTPTLSP